MGYHSGFTVYSLLILLIGIIWFCRRSLGGWKAKKSYSPSPSSKDGETFSEDLYYQIEPLPSFEWRTTDPIQIRPFKTKYHLTMALENTTISELLNIDNTYLNRIRLRRQLIENHGSTIVDANEIVTPAVNEFYTWMTGTYLPLRYPTMFQVVQNPNSVPMEKPQSLLINLATAESIAINPPPTAIEALRLLGSQIDTEFLFLLPSSDPADEGKYKLEGYVTCFPSGFDMRKKLNLTLTGIHTPVPGYAVKLEKSMDRFFAALPAGKIVKRVNWSITTNADLFALGGNHIYEGEDTKEEKIDLEKTVLRCERQTLHRLPQSKALVFAFKTFQYPIRQIKEEGNGELLARAIEGLSEGSVPRMAYYKRGVIWGETVKDFLRS